MKGPARRDLTRQVDKILGDSFLLLVAKQTVMSAEEFFFRKRGRSSERVLEIGSAGGVVAELRPGWVTSDVVKSVGVKHLLRAGSRLPFENQSFDMIFMQDTLHHVANLDFFFAEADRVLVNDGLIFLKEPAYTPLAQLIFRSFHPEDFSLRKLRTKNSWRDPMLGNQALAWGLIKNHRGMFTPLIAKYEIESLGNSMGVAFILSGGSTFTTKVPRKWLIALHRLETKSPAWLTFAGIAHLLALSKKPTQLETC